MTRVLDKSPYRISLMFDEISAKYDILNHLISLGMDIYWRRKILEGINKYANKKDKILDLASGTGDMTRELLNLNPDIIFSFDISEKMLEIQKEKIKDDRVLFKVVNSDNLPLESDSIDILTICFGVRNFKELNIVFKEIRRVLKPDGCLIILEMFGNLKDNYIFKLYFNFLIPFIGRLISKSNYAYEYLKDSVSSFYSDKDFTEIANKNGFKIINSDNNIIGFVKTLYFSAK